MAESPLERRQRAELVGEAGRRSEVRTASRMGGKLRPASGATRGKGDFELDLALVEAKSTSKGSISIQLGWLRKVTREALMEGRTPVLTITYTDPSGRPCRDGRWALVPEDVVKDLLR